MKRYVVAVFLSLFLLSNYNADAWGFFAHRLINRLAVFLLPPEMVPFYKTHIQYITENAINPDQRRYVVKGEAPRHYIDVDVYGDSAVYKMPRYWDDAVAKYTEDTLMAYGIGPWNIYRVKFALTKAFQKRDVDNILRFSADLGHYIGDGNVPLHTTENYNGQLTGQYGIHGFWESRLPELFSDQYDFFMEDAAYVENPQLRAWKGVIQAHQALDSVLRFEKELTEKFGDDRKYGYDERGTTFIRTYSRDFSEAYHEMLNGMVERQMRASIKMVADFWYTCWVDAGQPDLDALLSKDLSAKEKARLEAEEKSYQQKRIKTREHGG